MKPLIIAALIFISLVGGSPVFCAPALTFKSAAAQAANHFGTPAGHKYAMTFVRAVLKATYDATQACKQSPPDAIHDIVFIVSSSGRIERTIAGGKSAYGRCLAERMHLPDKIAPPPGDHWAIQLRFVNGPRKIEGPDPPFIVLSLPGQ